MRTHCAIPERSAASAPPAAASIPQRKLVVGEADDPFERHADALADRVMRAGAVPTAPPDPPPPSPRAQRKCTECEEDEVRLFRGPNPAVPSPDVEAEVGELGGGVPLSAEERAFFEPRFGFDFGAVRVHSDAQAARAAQALSAEAFTVGSHIAFNRGRYPAAGEKGRRLLAHELAHVVQQRAASPMERGTRSGSSTPPDVQRSESEAPAAGGAPASGALLVDDQTTPAEGQMQKSAFLAQLRVDVCATAAEELAGTQWSAAGCPWLDHWFDYYADKDAAHIERALHRYAPEADGARTARDYIPAFCRRVRQGIQRWSRTGELPDLPEGVEIPGSAVLGALSAVGSAVSSVVSAIGDAFSAIGGLFTKRREGASATATSLDDPRQRLGRGELLDGGTRARMERALGHDFSSVRIHRDSAGSDASASVGARAFTIGDDIAFSGGEYRPGTPVGDVLLAHELAHVVQQRAAPAGATGDVGALERDADRAAAAGALALWSGGTASARVVPALGARPSIQRCGASQTAPARPAAAFYNEPGSAPARPMTPAADPLLSDQALSVSSWGGSQWNVKMTLPAAATQAGWFIQHIQQNTDVRNPDGTPNAAQSRTYEFWEPLSSIPQNATESGRSADDHYGSTPNAVGSRGRLVTTGKVKFYTGTLPRDLFVTNDPQLGRFGEVGPLTRVRPAWWDDTGTVHNLTVTWNWTGANEPTRMQGLAGTRVMEYPTP